MVFAYISQYYVYPYIFIIADLHNIICILVFISADYKNINWAYEYPSKPTSRINDDFISVTNEVMQKDTLKPIAHNRSYTGSNTFPKPDHIPKEVPVPKWGLYHPPNYEEPIRYNHFPPIKYNGY